MGCLENFSRYLELLGGNSGKIFRRFYMIFVSRPNGNDDDNDDPQWKDHQTSTQAEHLNTTVLMLILLSVVDIEHFRTHKRFFY